jgi:hypothetical protein
MHRVEEFARMANVEEYIDDLRKGALAAQKPGHIDDIPELNDEDREHLRREVTQKWKHPRVLYFTIVMCSM